MPTGMLSFVEGPIYGGMKKEFAQQFGDTIVPMPINETVEVEFGSTPVYAGVSFSFIKGVVNDFPAASILIGGKAYIRTGLR